MTTIAENERRGRNIYHGLRESLGRTGISLRLRKHTLSRVQVTAGAPQPTQAQQTPQPLQISQTLQATLVEPGSHVSPENWPRYGEDERVASSSTISSGPMSDNGDAGRNESVPRTSGSGRSSSTLTEDMEDPSRLAHVAQAPVDQDSGSAPTVLNRDSELPIDQTAGALRDHEHCGWSMIEMEAAQVLLTLRYGTRP